MEILVFFRSPKSKSNIPLFDSASLSLISPERSESPKAMPWQGCLLASPWVASTLKGRLLDSRLRLKIIISTTSTKHYNYINNHNLLKYYQIPSHAVNCEIAATSTNQGFVISANYPSSPSVYKTKKPRLNAASSFLNGCLAGTRTPPSRIRICGATITPRGNTRLTFRTGGVDGARTRNPRIDSPVR